MMAWGKQLCTWCEGGAITTVVQMKACQAHHDEYHRRRQAGGEWNSIHHDFCLRRWAEDDKRRQVSA